MNIRVDVKWFRAICFGKKTKIIHVIERIPLLPRVYNIFPIIAKRPFLIEKRPFFIPVGAAGFEPTTSSTRTKRAAKLRHAPNMRLLYQLYHGRKNDWRIE